MAYNDEVSAPLAPTITAVQLKSVLDVFVGIDNVTVTGGSGSFTVIFIGTQSTTNMEQIFGDAANASNGSTTRTITTAYDVASQVTSVAGPSSTINFILDNLGRATTVAQSVNGLTPTVTLNQAFDAMNNRTELKATIGSTLDFKNTYQFDALQRLTDIVQQGQSGGNAVTAKHVTQSFNALSQRTQIARYQSTGTSNAVATSDFTFDTANRLSGIAHKQGATNLNTYAYTYDPLSRIATIVSTLEGTDTYSYDQTSQLVSATHTSQANETYGFDANGNRNTSGFTTGTNNQTTAGLGFTYTFDDEGNRTSKTETSTGKIEEYTWDHRNRLTKVVFRNTSGGAIVKQVDYEYDAYNRLVRRTFDADGAGAGAATNQYWVYDEGINAVLHFDGSSASNLSHRYLWSDNVDELLADEQFGGSNTLWGLADHLGSLRDIADYIESTGVTTIANHRTINSFGNLISETNTSVDLIYAFTGKQSDEATGLQHNLFRWLDPSLGQWLNEDPVGFAAGDENIRRYVGNMTIDLVDPTGLQEQGGDGNPDIRSMIYQAMTRAFQQWMSDNEQIASEHMRVRAEMEADGRINEAKDFQQYYFSQWRQWGDPTIQAEYINKLAILGQSRDNLADMNARAEQLARDAAARQSGLAAAYRQFYLFEQRTAERRQREDQDRYRALILLMHQNNIPLPPAPPPTLPNPGNAPQIPPNPFWQPRAIAPPDLGPWS